MKDFTELPNNKDRWNDFVSAANPDEGIYISFALTGVCRILFPSFDYAEGCMTFQEVYEQ